MNRRHGRWRARAFVVIERAIEAARGDVEPDALRRVLRAVYPFGQRRCWPYRVWLDEINRQLGAGRYARGVPRVGRMDFPGQTYLFNDKETT